MSKISAITPRNVDEIGKKVELQKGTNSKVNKTPLAKYDSLGLGPGVSNQNNKDPVKPKGFVFNLAKKKKRTTNKHSTLKEIPDNNLKITEALPPRSRTPSQLQSGDPLANIRSQAKNTVVGRSIFNDSKPESPQSRKNPLGAGVNLFKQDTGRKLQNQEEKKEEKQSSGIFGTLTNMIHTITTPDDQAINKTK